MIIVGGSDSLAIVVPEGHEQYRIFREDMILAIPKYNFHA
jgi:hypothetical protein